MDARDYFWQSGPTKPQVTPQLTTPKQSLRCLVLMWTQLLACNYKKQQAIDVETEWKALPVILCVTMCSEVFPVFPLWSIFVNKSLLSLVFLLSTWHCSHLLLNTVLRHRCCWTSVSIDISYPHDSQQQACPTPLLLSNDATWQASRELVGLRAHHATFTRHETKLTSTDLKPSQWQLLRQLWRRL